MLWNREQQQALDKVGRWIRSPSEQVFRLFGYAGTGKTTLARHLAATADGLVLFAAFTGKAAHVLQRKGCEGASTIHQLIYHPREKGRQRLKELEQALNEARAHNESTDSPAIRELQEQIEAERDALTRPMFALNPESELADASLLVVDECSMVNEELADDLLSFGTPILVLGDPAQLPPVFGGGAFTEAEPDAMLTEIHRQAAENPIIAMATAVRERRPLDYGQYGESAVIPVPQFDRDAIDPDREQVLVGRNATRRRANQRIRRNFLGDPPRLVAPRDKLVCLRNDHQVGLLNGSIWRAVDAVDGATDDRLDVELTDDDGEGRKLRTSIHTAPLIVEDVDHWTRQDAHEFDYGYALTVHKAQGSQWPQVTIVDESRVFRGHAAKFLYTAITRAEQRVTIVR